MCKETFAFIYASSAACSSAVNIKPASKQHKSFYIQIIYVIFYDVQAHVSDLTDYLQQTGEELASATFENTQLKEDAQQATSIIVDLRREATQLQSEAGKYKDKIDSEVISCSSKPIFGPTKASF